MQYSKAARGFARSACVLVIFGAMFGMAVAVQAQALPMYTLATLPGTVEETSGLICTGPNRLWTHNDGGGSAKLYQIDTMGTISRTLVVRGVMNIDWEDLSQDAAGNVYIGDFGNNNNDRTNLVILKLPPLDSVVGDTVDAVRIDYTYPNQFAFPPADSLKNFDMEAFVTFGDSLYLFSKNRTVPFDGYTYLYRLPQVPGTYIAELIDSFYAGPGPTLNYWICGAALRPDAKQLVLMSYARCWIFSCFEGADFFGGSVVQRTWSFSQKEAAAWRDSTHLFLTDELLNGLLGGKLYLADMTDLVATPNAMLGPDTVHVGDTLWLVAPQQVGASYLWSTGTTNDSLAITQSGTYMLQVTAPNGCLSMDSIMVDLITFVQENAVRKKIQAVPNPFTDATSIIITWPNVAIVDWRIHNMLGTVVAKGRNRLDQSSSLEVTIDASWPSGIYLLEVLTDEQSSSTKLIKL